MIALSIGTATCGGDSGSGGTTAPDNAAVAVVITPSTPQSLTSGTIFTFTASATARDGHAITNPPIVWTSSNPAVAAMAGPQLSALKAGTATITATSGSANANVTVTVTPGVVQRLAVRTQPTGATIGALLATQPVIELQDLAGNLVASSAFVTAAIASGGGTLTGTVTLAAVAGVVTFTDLRVGGTPGSRTLGFTAGALSTTSAPFTMSAAPTPLIAVDATVIALSAVRGSSPAPRTINITNGGSQPLVGITVDVAYDAGQKTGWLQPTLIAPDAPTTLTLKVDTTGVIEGTYHATVHVNGPGAPNSPVSISVTLTVTPNYTVNYGSNTEKVRVVDVGGTFAPTVAIADLGGNAVPGVAVTFTSRANTVATVAADGRITAVGRGDTWIVASAPGASDSVFVVVPGSLTAPVMRSDATTYTTRAGDTLFVNIIFDARTTDVGAASLAVDLNVFSGVLAFSYSVPTSTPAPVVNVPVAGLWRISVASANGITGTVTVLNLKLVGRVTNTVGWLSLYALDVSGVDGTNLTAQSSTTRLPFVFR